MDHTPANTPKLTYSCRLTTKILHSIEDEQTFEKFVYLNAKSYGMIFDTKKTRRYRNRLFRKLKRYNLI